MKYILIIDDDAEVLEMIAEILDGTYRVMTAISGRSALRVLSETDIDCIVLDLMMPEMSGEEFAAELRRRAIAVPIVVASARYDTAQTARRIGAEEYVIKPFKSEELVRKIERATSGTSGEGSAGNGSDRDESSARSHPGGSTAQGYDLWGSSGWAAVWI